MISYYNSYFDSMHAQQMDYRLVDKAPTNDQISSFYPSSSPENYDVNGQICNDKKTTEVWREVDDRGQNNVEDFLVKAGGLNLMPPRTVDLTAVNDWSRLQVMQQQHMTMSIPNDVVDSRFRLCGHSNDFAMMPSVMVPVVNNCFDNGFDRKLICSSFKEEMMEKTIEKKRNRMIKNRESAARSRSRKQAHTHQLELKLFELRKTNNKLKKYKEAMKHLPEHSTNEPRYQLRRISSASF